MIAALAIWAAISAAPRQPARASNHSGKIRGVVVDAATSAPIADAQVAIGDTTRAVVTGVDGRFTFDDVAAGEVTLAASRIGYIFVYRRVTVADDATIELTFALTAGTGTYQERVTVAGSAPSLSNRSVQLNSADLQELRGIGADDPIRALQALPGVAASDDFQAEFSVRGSAFRHVGYVIDGTATPLLTHAVRGEEDTGSISMINTDVLARASLHAGPHALTQGDWIGPSVEFDLREGSRDRTGLRGAVSATFASAVIEGPVGRSKRGSWLLSTRVSYIDWLLRRVDPDIVSTIGFTDCAGEGRLRHRRTSADRVRLRRRRRRLPQRPGANREPGESRRLDQFAELAALALQRVTRRLCSAPRGRDQRLSQHRRGGTGRRDWHGAGADLERRRGDRDQQRDDTQCRPAQRGARRHPDATRVLDHEHGRHSGQDSDRRHRLTPR
jgi:hypothetical protein